jgi:hypothetical protein
MLTNKFAMVVDNDVFDVLEFTPNLDISGRWVAGMSSNPTFIKVNLVPDVCAGSFWDGESFFLPGDDLRENPLVPSESDNLGGAVKYAAIVDGDVFGTITYDLEAYSPEEIEMLDAAMQSNPQSIPVESSTQVLPGWTWDGQSFNP